jgi:hypothetical protein
VYLRRGLAITRASFGVQMQIVAVYAAPALAAAYLSTLPEPAVWQQVLRQVLPWMTAILGTVVVMAAVARWAHGEPTGLAGATWLALPWVPRYVWTNLHTTVIFWVPVGLLLQARTLQSAQLPLAGWVGVVVDGLWWVSVGVAGLTMHTRTLLAPFFAIHGDRPGTLAALEAWRVSGRHFGVCLSTLVAAGAPVALPLAGLAAALVLTLPPAAAAAILVAAPNLVWAAIQCVRPLLIPAVYLLYADLQQAELVRRQRDGEPSIPGIARGLLAFTRPLPHLGQPL